MTDEVFIFDEIELASLLKNQIINESQTLIQAVPKEDFSGFEYISTLKPKNTPIMTMNRDELIKYIQENEMSELKKLSDEELDYIVETIGIQHEAF